MSEAEGAKKSPRKRGRRAKRRTGLDTPDLRWKAGREPKQATVKGRPFNMRLLETDLGLVRVSDNRDFQKGLKIPVWVEQGTGKLVCVGSPKQLDRWE